MSKGTIINNINIIEGIKIPEYIDNIDITIKIVKDTIVMMLYNDIYFLKIVSLQVFFFLIGLNKIQLEKSGVL